MAVRDRIEHLNRRIQKANEAYYNQGEPILSDPAYDALRKELEELAGAHPQHRHLAPVLGQVGADPEGGAAGEHPHPVPMLSLDNVWDLEEWKSWVRSIGVEGQDIEWLVEPKFDGVSLSLHYTGPDGTLERALKRGNGQVGEEVTSHALEIEGIPATIDGGPRIVRGEVVLPRNRFERMNEARDRRGEPPMANPRSAVAGTLHLDDPRPAGERGLQFVAFDLLDPERKTTPFRTQEEALRHLEARGFQVPGTRALAASSKEVSELARRARADWSEDVDLDGLVIKANDRALREKLGNGSRSPRWAIAWKFPEIASETVLEGVLWQVGRTGRIAPRGKVSPVMVDGVQITYATLHNPDWIRRLGVRKGDHVDIVRGGDVIPRIERVAEEKRTGREESIPIPEECPECGGGVEEKETEEGRRGKNLFCVNEHCPSRLRRRLIHFTSGHGLDMDAWGPKTIDLVIEGDQVSSIPDFLALRMSDLQGLPGVGAKKAANLVQAIEEGKKQPYWRVLVALGLPGVGRETARALAGTFPSINALSEARASEIEEVDGMGPAKARALEADLANEARQEEVRALASHGFQMETEAGEGGEEPGGAEDAPLEGLTLALTGRLSESREKVRERIEALGGRVTGSVTSRTSALLAGDGGGSKREQAGRLGVPVIGEDDLERWIRSGGDA